MEHAFSNYLRHQPISVVKRELRGESLNEKEHQESAMRGELHHHAMPPHHQSPSEIEKVAMRCGSASLSLCHCLCLCLSVCVVCVFVWALAQVVGARILRGNIDWRQKQDQVKHAKVKQHKAASNQDKLRSEGWGRVGSGGSGGNRGRRGLRSGALHESRQPITITRQTIRPDARGGERGERKPGEREPSNAAHVQEDGRKDVGAQGGSVKDEGKEGVGQAAGKEGVGQAAGKEGVGQAAGPPSSPPSVASSSPPSPPTRTHLLVCLSVCCCMQMQCVIEILHEIARKTGGEMGWLESMREAWRAKRHGALSCVMSHETLMLFLVLPWREGWCVGVCDVVFVTCLMCLKLR